MNTKTLNPNEMNFVSTLLMNGYSLDQALALIGKSSHDTNAVNRTVSSAKIEAPKESKKPTTSKGSKKPTSSKEEKFGNIKVGDYYKVVNLKTKELVKVGKCKVIKDNFVYSTTGENAIAHAIENCVKISKADYGKLKKSVAKKNEKKSSSTKLSPKDYKAVYALNLKNLGKITDSDFENIIKDDAKLSETYHQFKDQVKLGVKEALEIFAKNCESSSSK